jgi:hypothetical protein
MTRAKRWVEDAENEVKFVALLFVFSLAMLTAGWLTPGAGGSAAWLITLVLLGIIGLIAVGLIVWISSVRASASRGQWVWFALVLTASFAPIYWILDKVFHLWGDD